MTSSITSALSTVRNLSAEEAERLAFGINDVTVDSLDTTADSQVHYWELSNYNSGRLVGRWFDISTCSQEEHQEEINEWLHDLTIVTGELCEEWIVGDTEGVESQYVGEWSIGDGHFDMIEFMQNTHLEAEVIAAGLALGFELDSIEENYYGSFKSEEDLAYEHIDSTGMLSEVPDSIRNYFDYAAFGRDLAMDFSSFNTHYFH
jgi:antirestriction protein